MKTMHVGRNVKGVLKRELDDRQDNKKVDGVREERANPTMTGDGD